ncbi:hypothetical protein [Edaphobacter modestus]|uniref:hypothetical protein n=1 Tax=Edaphobacter modestus TaxID=388466 RepID=UPI00102D03D4|nr:hypothetical protein [Edaphobacter modestus]
MPITISSNTNYFVNQRTDRADRFRPLHIRNQSVNNWFGTDTTAYVPVTTSDQNGTSVVNGCSDLKYNPVGLGCAYGPESTIGLGTSRVGAERAPSYHNLDAALSKAFTITGEKQLAFRADFFNVLNTTNLAPPSNNISATNFGQITSTVSTERQIQLALKLTF